jgi:hypothetical protein
MRRQRDAGAALSVSICQADPADVAGSTREDASGNPSRPPAPKPQSSGALTCDLTRHHEPLTCGGLCQLAQRDMSRPTAAIVTQAIDVCTPMPVSKPMKLITLRRPPARTVTVRQLESVSLHPIAGLRPPRACDSRCDSGKLLRPECRRMRGVRHGAGTDRLIPAETN